MQSVSAAFTAEEDKSVRRIVQNTRISWHRDSKLANRTFTIGTSTIGGNDAIGAIPGAIGSPANYRYFDESPYITSLSWERGLNLPTGGLTKAFAEIRLDNTSGRFTPRYLGGSSELYTAIQPRKPVVVSAGFNVGGVEITMPQFAGVIIDQPSLDLRSKDMRIKAADYVDFFQNKYLDQAAMYTSQRSDVIMASLLAQAGMSTAQYDLDTGINIPPFVGFDVGTKFSDAIRQLVEAEAGNFYQDESGIFKFDNRQHWDSAPYTQVQRIISTAQVLDAEAPNLDHLVNVVEINSEQRAKQPLQIIMNSTTPTLVNGNGTVAVFFSYDDPVLAVTTPTAGGVDSFFVANTNSDLSGTNMTSFISVKSISNFAQASKIVFQNNSATTAYITNVVLKGRPVKKVADIYYREQDSSSVTAYQERPLVIDNPFIGSPGWAQSLARMILNDYSDIENLQRITIRAIPELQLGDLVSWQGRYWRIYDIKATLDAQSGFIQELLLLQRNVTSYFRIGVSTIGGSAKIAP